MSTVRLILGLLDGLVFFIFIMGCIFLGLCYMWARENSAKNEKMAACTVDAKAEVTHLNVFQEDISNEDDITPRYRDKYDADYTFTVDGVEYKGNYDSYSRISMGDYLDIKYDPNDPNNNYLAKEVNKDRSGDIRDQLFFYPGFIMTVFGLVTAIILTIIGKVLKAKEKKKREEEFERRRQERLAEIEKARYEGL